MASRGGYADRWNPFVLSLSKHCPSFRGQEEQPFDRLRANGE
jgi:hypothetical protein